MLIIEGRFRDEMEGCVAFPTAPFVKLGRYK